MSKVTDEAFELFKQELDEAEKIVLERWAKHIKEIGLKHLPGRHDQDTHGSWADDLTPSNGSEGEEVDYEGKGFVTIYHGTHDEFVDSIKETGIKRGSTSSMGRGRAVFFIESLKDAITTGTRLLGWEMRSGESPHREVIESGLEKNFAVVRIRMPEAYYIENRKIDKKHDEDFGTTTAGYVLEDIPPEWIQGIYIYGFDWEYADPENMTWDEKWPGSWSPDKPVNVTHLRTIKEGEYKTVYHVVLFKPKETKHLPGQHDQKTHGSWATGYTGEDEDAWRTDPDHYELGSYSPELFDNFEQYEFIVQATTKPHYGSAPTFDALEKNPGLIHSMEGPSRNKLHMMTRDDKESIQEFVPSEDFPRLSESMEIETQEDNWSDGTPRIYGYTTITREQVEFVKRQVDNAQMRRDEYVLNSLGVDSTYHSYMEGLPHKNADRSDMDRGMWNDRDVHNKQFLSKAFDGFAIEDYTRGDLGNLLSVYRDQVERDVENGIISEELGEKYRSNITFGIAYAFDRRVEFEAKKAISTGRLEPIDLDKLGHGSEITDLDRSGRPMNTRSQGWSPLPDTMWHVTTAASAVRDEQLKSRYEMEMSNGVGLAGGDDLTISFTADLKTAQGIEQALHDAHAVASGDVTIENIVESAKRGDGAPTPFYREIEKLMGRGIVGDGDSRIDRLIVDRDRSIERGDNDRVIELTWDFFRYYYLKARERAGGPIDPVFFGTDHKGLAKLDPSEFIILEYSPANSRAKGIDLGAGLGEWRIVGADGVELTGEIDHILDDIFEELDT